MREERLSLFCVYFFCRQDGDGDEKVHSAQCTVHRLGSSAFYVRRDGDVRRSDIGRQILEVSLRDDFYITPSATHHPALRAIDNRPLEGCLQRKACAVRAPRDFSDFKTERPNIIDKLYCVCPCICI